MIKMSPYQQERFNFSEQLNKCTKTISNLPKAISRELSFSHKLNTAWGSGGIKVTKVNIPKRNALRIGNIQATLSKSKFN